MFNRSFPTATFDVEVICDDIVEFNQRCTLEFDPPNIAGFTQGLRSTVVEIAECEEDCEFVQFLADLTECRLPFLSRHVYIQTVHLCCIA